MNRKSVFAAIFLILCLLVSACNMPEGYPTQVPTGVGETSPTPTALAQEVPSLTPTTVPGAAPVVNCSPTVTANTDANVRSGPGQVYGVIGYIPTGGTAPVAGKNAEGTWWYIQFAAGAGGYAWIAGSVTTSNCIPAALAVIAAPPTPVIPPTTVASNTPVPAGPPSATPTWMFLFPIDPGIFLVPTATPTLSFTIPTIEIPCLWLGC